jgi:predicted ATPase
VLQERLDRLEPELRELLRVASVIGRSFLQRVLQAVTHAGSALESRLEALINLEFIHERRGTPDIEYTFKHGLIQETAYNSILERRRRELHELIARSVEALFADRLEEFYAVLAYHFSQAEQWEKAQDYLIKAGDQAGRLAGNAEAVAHYQGALEIHTRTFQERWAPVNRAALERKMGEVLFELADYDAGLR